MITYKQSTTEAKKILNGQWTKVVLVSALYIMITIGTNSLSNSKAFNQTISFLLGAPLSLGFSIYFLNISRNKEARVEQLFYGFKNIINVTIAAFLITVTTVIGLFLFIIPGIIIGISLSQTLFILADDRSIGAIEAMRKSIEMINGYKMEYFKMYLEFIGWGILCIFTLGFGLLILLPYVQTCKAFFYNNLKNSEVYKY